MGTITAAANGNWNTPATWVGGVVPVDSDTANAGAYAITLDVDVNQPNTTLTATTGYFVYSGTGTRNVTAKANAGSHSSAGLIRNTSSGTLNFTGEIKGGNAANAYGGYNSAAGTFTATTVTGGSDTGAAGLISDAGGAANATNAQGGSGNFAYGLYNYGAGTATIATATAGSGNNAHGAFNETGGTLNVGTAIGNGYGVGGTTTNIAYGVFGRHFAGASTKVKAVQSGPYGAVPIGGAVLITEDADNNTAQFRKAANGATLTLIHEDAVETDYPLEADVREGTEYGDSAYTGTLIVPAAASVAYGVPVDATVGTAVLTAGAVADAVWDEAASGHLTAGSTGKALNDAGAAADPWNTALPGSYTAGKAGWILGERLDAKVSSVSGGSPGSGGLEWSYTLTEAGTGALIPEADVWVTSDPAGATLIASGRTNAAGIATFYLDAGTYYIWRQRAGWNFTNPDTEIVA